MLGSSFVDRRSQIVSTAVYFCVRQVDRDFYRDYTWDKVRHQPFQRARIGCNPPCRTPHPSPPLQSLLAPVTHSPPQRVPVPTWPAHRRSAVRRPLCGARLHSRIPLAMGPATNTLPQHALLSRSHSSAWQRGTSPRFRPQTSVAAQGAPSRPLFRPSRSAACTAAHHRHRPKEVCAGTPHQYQRCGTKPGAADGSQGLGGSRKTTPTLNTWRSK